MTLARSVRQAARLLARNRAFTAGAALTLALGIGLSTAVFTVADALLLRPLPVADQARLVTVWSARRDRSVDHWPLGYAQTRAFSAQTRTLRATAYYAYEGAFPIAIRDGDQLTRVRRALVSGNYFDVLGARAAIGRTLQPSDNVVGAPLVAVLSHRAWINSFGGDPHVVGRQLSQMEFGTTATIVGVMPAGLEYPQGTDVWAAFVPNRLQSNDDTVSYAALDLVGRLTPGATPANVASELTDHFRRSGNTWLEDLHGVATPFDDVVLGDTRPALLIVAAGAALLLLITCMDVANLLLVRGLAREREIAVRGAIGGTRGQVVAQLVAENALLAVLGGAVGLAVAIASVRAFRAFAPANVPLLDTVHVNGAALAGAVAITAAATIVFGLAPAFVTARADVQDVLRSGTRQSQGRRARLVREALVSAQVALAATMLCAAALIGRSFVKLRGADLRFDANRVLVAELAIRYDQYDDADKQTRLLDALIPALRAVPGVEGVSPVVAMPFSGTAGWTGTAGIEGQTPADARKNPMFNMDVVTPDYFPTMGLRVLRGRAFTDADRTGSEQVVVVSQALARAYWPDRDAIGQRMYIGGDLKDVATVVGIVDDIRYRDLRTPTPSVYHALAQSTFPFAPTLFVVRTASDPAAIVSALRRTVRETASGVELATAAPFETYMRQPLAQPRLNAFLLGVFAVSAALLAAIGLGGVVATSVRQRTQELGVRMALGATSGDVERMILRQALAIAAVGVVAGIAAAVAANRALGALLYDVSPTDPGTLLAVAAFLTLVALASALLPARSAGRVNPLQAMRAD